MLNPTSTSLIFLFLHLVSAVYSIGVNYGTLGNNLPSPAAVANFLKTRTAINGVKLFDVNPEYIQAFANTGISVAVTAPNSDIVPLAEANFARQWVVDKIKPFYPATKINFILVGSEVLHWGDQKMFKKLVPAMRSLHSALQAEGINDIKVTTAHSLIIMMAKSLPSAGQFRPGFAKHVLGPMLKFLRETKAPFMVNPYPYFDLDPARLDFALFRPNLGLYDRATRLTYTNQFDALIDTVHFAMKALGFADVDIAIGETGWPTNCDNPVLCSVANAVSYNGGLVKHVESGKGTPMLPNRRFETYIFALFNENQKPGPTAERNWGLFQPDLTPIYDSGIFRNGQQVPVAPSVPVGGGGEQWCVPKAEATIQALQSNIDYVCSQGVDCRPIQPGGACFVPNDPKALATYAMSAYYKAKGPIPINCDFSGSGILTTINPSHGGCRM
ncbi:glucan endo-1,3-beta-glucosidase [Senna tora]|uniref:glucan endo-1,3-beta-D-glucosidase n=1 Tax=Senna tora TaxID=362788 RepID=A0A834TJV2_9FABA|nr:glucan endo-1,3-beta-glucosidase [Senna tora]